MDECGIGVAYERKTGEGTLGSVSDVYVVGFRHGWCIAAGGPLTERETRRSRRLDRGRRAWMARSLRGVRREPLVLIGGLPVDRR